MSLTLSPDMSIACVCGRLRRASRALTQLYDDLMAPCGLRVTQFSLLRTLARHELPVRISGERDASDGICQGGDEDGALLLRTSDGVTRILAGDVSLRPLGGERT